jgi:glycosyltransferase involved in cell wall biosynthesis
LDHTVVTCADTEGGPTEAVFRPVEVYDVPECPDIKLACPPVLEIVDYCFRQNFTHIHSVTPGPVGLVGLLAARLLNRPFFATHDRTLTLCARHITGDQSLEGLLWTYLRWFYGQAGKVFVPSDSCRDELVDNGIRPERIVLLSNGVDIERFRPRDWGERREMFTLLYVGSVSRESGLDVLAEALQQMRRDDVRLVVVGDGPYRDELRRQLAGLPIEFAGCLQGDDLARTYREADLLIIPSAADTSDSAVLEAQACAVPVVIRDGAREHPSVISGETGMVFASDGARALARDIESILDRPSLMKLGLRARELVEQKCAEHAFYEQWRLCQQP